MFRLPYLTPTKNPSAPNSNKTKTKLNPKHPNPPPPSKHPNLLLPPGFEAQGPTSLHPVLLNPIPYITLYYPILPYITLYYPILPYITLYYPILPYITLYYPILPYITLYYPIYPKPSRPLLDHVLQKLELGQEVLCKGLPDFKGVNEGPL